MFPRKVRPLACKVAGIVQDLVTREHAYPEDGSFSFKARKLVLDLCASFGQRLVPSSEVGLHEFARVIEVEEFIFSDDQLLEFAFSRVDQKLLLAQHFICGGVVRVQFVG